MKRCLTSWGCYPKHNADYYQPTSVAQLEVLLTQLNAQPCWIPRGLGRSYGDSALSQAVCCSASLNRFISFDANTGILDCQTGVSLAEILAVIISQGWFLPVTPGTKWVSLGGAIASDVHGKNHHQVGSFSAFIEELELVTADGTRLICSRQRHAAIFYASCGGMGLTGFILRARLHLLKISSGLMTQQTIKTKSLAETLEILAQHDASPYSVAWLDCTAPAKQLGRSLIFLGQHATQDVLAYSAAELAQAKSQSLLGFAAPLLNAYSIKLFNALYYHSHKQQVATIPINQYFYPLDSLPHWNLLYGKNGFTQYQFVIPHAQHQVLQRILLSIRAFGACSFLSVLKVLGKENNNYLSFPMEGLTLAIDFKISDRLWPFLNQLDQQVMAAGGRVYLTKDCRLPASHFHKMYPRWQEFLEIKAKLDPFGKVQSLQSVRLGM